MNRMNEVFELVGVKPNEQFKVKQMNGIYSFDRMGRLWKSVEHTKVEMANVSILDFLRGILTIEEVGNMYSKVEQMLEMQKALDAAIYKEHEAEFSTEECKLAIIDEIGELNHELKSTWCWWKKTQKEADRKKALGELVDLWHFVMNYHYHCYSRVYDEQYLEWLEDSYEYEILSNVYNQIIETPSIELMIILSWRLDYSIDEVYDAYIEKNKVNYERLANGY